MKARTFLCGMVAVLLVAAALRLIACGQVPAGLYHDEAYNGLDALDVLHGRLSLYFPANNGREPLFIYLVALAVGLLGRSPVAARLAAFPVGLLTVAVTGALGKALFSRRVGLLSAAVLAVTLWHVHLSRVSFRAVTLPLLIGLMVWQGALGCRGAEGQGSKRWVHWAAAGVFYGLSFYTYTAARFTPVALVAFGIYVWAVKSRIQNPKSKIHIALAVLAAIVTIAPLATYTALHPDVVLGRPGQVSISNPEINGGDLWGTLGRHTLRALGMFFVRGDRIWRHNVPWRPVFDPLLGAAFVVGLLVALRRVRRDLAAGLILLWTAVMLLPTILAEDAPHFLRAVGVLPLAAVFPALGLDFIKSQVPDPKSGITRPWGIVHWSLIILPLLFGLVSTAWSYFGDYAHDPMTGYWFERGSVALAARVNESLGVGWDGERMRRGAEEQGSGGAGERHVYIDSALWDEWPQVRFLVAAPERVTVGLEATPTSNFQPPISNLAIFAWPYRDWSRAWALVPHPAELAFEEGPLSQGDRDPEPFTTYLAFFAAPPDPSVPALAHFSGGVELLDVDVTPLSPLLPGGDREGIRVRLRWRATAPLADDYTVFLHYVRNGERLSQADSRAAIGLCPTTMWRPGDIVNDDHVLTGIDSRQPGDILRFGFWQPESGAVLYLLDEAGNPAGDWIEVPVNGN